VPQAVEVTTKDGGRHRAEVTDHLLGHPQRPLSREQVHDKFHLGSLMDWQIGGLLAFENSPSINAGLMIAICVVAGVAHQAGTCRFGRDPASSVLDVNCKAHELDNLYVVDTSFFVSIGAVNPSLTAMANAIRVGEHIAERLG